MPNEADKELFDLLEAYKEAIKSLHHTIEYHKLNLTPDEILDKEDVETERAKTALLAWRDRAVRAGRKNITDICTIDTDDSGNDYVSFFDGSKPAYTVTEFWNRLAALTAEPKEEV